MSHDKWALFKDLHIILNFATKIGHCLLLWWLVRKNTRHFVSVKAHCAFHLVDLKKYSQPKHWNIESYVLFGGNF